MKKKTLLFLGLGTAAAATAVAVPLGLTFSKGNSNDQAATPAPQDEVKVVTEGQGSQVPVAPVAPQQATPEMTQVVSPEVAQFNVPTTTRTISGVRHDVVVEGVSSDVVRSEGFSPLTISHATPTPTPMAVPGMLPIIAPTPVEVVAPNKVVNPESSSVIKGEREIMSEGVRNSFTGGVQQLVPTAVPHLTPMAFPKMFALGQDQKTPVLTPNVAPVISPILAQIEQAPVLYGQSVAPAPVAPEMQIPVPTPASYEGQVPIITPEFVQGLNPIAIPTPITTPVASDIIDANDDVNVDGTLAEIRARKEMVVEFGEATFGDVLISGRNMDGIEGIAYWHFAANSPLVLSTPEVDQPHLVPVIAPEVSHSIYLPTLDLTQSISEVQTSREEFEGFGKTPSFPEGIMGSYSVVSPLSVPTPRPIVEPTPITTPVASDVIDASDDVNVDGVKDEINNLEEFKKNSFEKQSLDRLYQDLDTDLMMLQVFGDNHPQWLTGEINDIYNIISSIKKA